MVETRNRFFYFLKGVLLIAFGVCFYTQNALGQEEVVLVEKRCDAWLGTPLSPESDAVCFFGKGSIQLVKWDSLHAILYVLMRDVKNGKLKNKGKLIAYNYEESRKQWSIPFDFSENSFFLGNGIPVLGDRWTTSGLDWETGAPRWKIDFQIGYVIDRGIGLAESSMGTKAVSAIDLSDGRVIWTKETFYNDVGVFNIKGDTAAIFLKNGLNYIDLMTGEGFSIKAKTMNQRSYSSASYSGAAIAGGVAASVLFGALFGVIIVPIPMYGGAVRQRSANSLSNLYLNKDGIFFASISGWYKVNYRGDLEWSKSFEKGTGSVHKIFVVDSAAYAVSKGMLSTENGPKYSDAVISRMAVNGEGEYGSMKLNTGKREYVQDFLVKDSTVILALNNKIIEIRLRDFEIVKERVFGDANHNASFGDILNPPAILYSDSTFVMDSEVHPDDFFVESFSGMKTRFSVDLEPVEVIRKENYFRVKNELPGGKMLITNGSEYYLVNLEGEKLLDFSFSSNVWYEKGWIFDLDEGKLLAIRL